MGIRPQDVPLDNRAVENFSNSSLWSRLALFINPVDARYEEITRASWYLIVLRDFSAGLIVAMMAITRNI